MVSRYSAQESIDWENLHIDMFSLHEDKEEVPKGTTTNSPVGCVLWGSDECSGTSVPHRSFYLPLGTSSSSTCSENISMCNFPNHYFLEQNI